MQNNEILCHTPINSMEQTPVAAAKSNDGTIRRRSLA
jgi:hypothetical protein